MIKKAQSGIKGGMAGAASVGAASATGAQIAEGLLAIGQGTGLTTVATITVPVAAAIGVGYAVSEAFGWLFG